VTKLYLDACCLSRLTDDQSQLRIRNESEAVERILGLVQSGAVEWMSSKVLLAEVARTPDAERRRDVARLLVFASAECALAPAVIDRASELERLGYDAFDALHFSCAEHAEVDVLLTTDDRFLRRAQRGIGSPRVRVLNRYHGEKRKYDDSPGTVIR